MEKPDAATGWYSEHGQNLARATIAEVREAIDFPTCYRTGAELLTKTHRPIKFVVYQPVDGLPAIFTGQIAATLAADQQRAGKTTEQTPLITARSPFAGAV